MATTQYWEAKTLKASFSNVLAGDLYKRTSSIIHISNNGTSWNMLNNSITNGPIAVPEAKSLENISYTVAVPTSRTPNWCYIGKIAVQHGTSGMSSIRSTTYLVGSATAMTADPTIVMVCRPASAPSAGTPFNVVQPVKYDNNYTVTGTIGSGTNTLTVGDSNAYNTHLSLVKSVTGGLFNDTNKKFTYTPAQATSTWTLSYDTISAAFYYVTKGTIDSSTAPTSDTGSTSSNLTMGKVQKVRVTMTASKTDVTNQDDTATVTSSITSTNSSTISGMTVGDLATGITAGTFNSSNKSITLTFGNTNVGGATNVTFTTTDSNGFSWARTFTFNVTATCAGIHAFTTNHGEINPGDKATLTVSTDGARDTVTLNCYTGSASTNTTASNSIQTSTTDTYPTTFDGAATTVTTSGNPPYPSATANVWAKQDITSPVTHYVQAKCQHETESVRVSIKVTPITVSIS